MNVVRFLLEIKVCPNLQPWWPSKSHIIIIVQVLTLLLTFWDHELSLMSHVVSVDPRRIQRVSNEWLLITLLKHARQDVPGTCDFKEICNLFSSKLLCSGLLCSQAIMYLEYVKPLCKIWQLKGVFFPNATCHQNLPLVLQAQNENHHFWCKKCRMCF